MPTAETVAQVKMADEVNGKQANKTLSRARTIEGFSIWIHLNWSDAQVPIMKLVWAHNKRARIPRGIELKVTKSDELKKNAIWEAISDDQTPKKAPDLKLSESIM